MSSQVETDLRVATLCLDKKDFGARRPSRSSLSSLSSACESEDSFDASRVGGAAGDLPEEGAPPAPGLDGKSQKLVRLMADIEKMKRRCKHILDVTDKVSRKIKSQGLK